MPSNFDDQGKFAKNNQMRLGKRNENAAAAYECKRELYKIIDPEKRRKLLTKLYQMAMKGNTAAHKILSDQIYGKPPVAVEVTHEGSTLQISLADIQLAIVEAVGIGTPEAQRVAGAIRQLHQKEEANGCNGSGIG